MDIIAGIGAATEGLKVVNELRKIDKELDKAELKLRLIDVAERLFEARQALQDAQEREFALRQTISGLESKLTERGKYKDRDGLLWELDENQNELGEPFCNHCHVKEDRRFRLLHGPYLPGAYKCANCGGYFGNKSQPSDNEGLVIVRRPDWDGFI